MKRFLAALCIFALAPLGAFAWGSVGHTMINRVAAESLPASLPAFVRTPAAIAEIAYLGPEEDRLKDAGTSWDDDNDPGHFLDLGDDGTIFGVVNLNALPTSMKAYATALAAAHTDPYRAGFVPYTIMDGWEQLRKEFALWRVDAYLAQHATTPTARARFARERTLRESLVLMELGTWGHFVGDGSQPLHVTVHFDGWGHYPNPNGYSESRHVHSMFETAFVTRHVTIGEVRARVPSFTEHAPPALLSQRAIAARIGAYLSASGHAVPELYTIDRSGGFERATPQAIDFTATQLARGAAELRDLVALAWEDSLNEGVGYPEVPVRDILNGTVAPRGE